MALPRGGDVLFAWVGPTIAVMEVDQHVHTQFLCAQGFVDHVFRAAKTILGVHPDAQTNGLQAEFFHQCGALPRFAARIGKTVALGLHFGYPTNVCTFVEGGFFRPCVVFAFLPVRLRCCSVEWCGKQEGNAAKNDAAQRALRALRVVFDDKCRHLFVFLV